MVGHKVKLTKIKSNHNNLRTREVIGDCNDLPYVGKGFFMWSAPLVEGSICRIVKTTPIQDVYLKDGVYHFHTENSYYQLECIEEDEEVKKEPTIH